MIGATIRTEDAAVIQPTRGKREPRLPATALLVFTPQDIGLVIDRFDDPPQHCHTLYLAKVHVGFYQGRQIAVAGPSLGAPQTILILEKLIALGVRNFLAFGWCGSLHPDVVIGDVIMPNSAVSEEGTSQHYPLGTTQPGPAPEIQEMLRQALQATDVKLHEGAVWTTDAPFRETLNKVVALQNKGILGVEMEVSALFTVARFRGVRLAAVLAVSDELFSLSWVHGFNHAVFKRTRQLLADLIIQTACSLAPPL
ncbi:nucleoside phosphorylase [Desulfoferrobacter suflitae]|uniref:nucleoside phosphorylase n=1 Tax=Desulfoferrobacter suflitae TaxID=2865782 RepID=UPI0021647007|nr:nucleoside phosphorylase [Desulfoferrobacter suflitae]MCK8602700.1 nucleoside phosphorylase [Desulfoferrobacter suflitae]